MSPPLVLRADAGVNLGTGHVMRCLGVAAAWRTLTGGPVTLAARALPARLEARVRHLGIEIITVTEPAASPGDAAETVAAARSAGAGHVLVDGYGFGAPFERRLRGAGLRVTAIDDDARAVHDADLLVDPGLAASTAAYPSGTRILAGSAHAPIRPEFLAHRDAPRGDRTGLRRVLVTLGGSDPARMTPRAIDGLAPLGLDVRVVLGGAVEAPDELAAHATRAGCTVLRDVEDIGAQMAWADLAVAAAGVTLLELLCVGTPSLLVVVAENQAPGARAAEREGAAIVLGTPAEVSPERIATAVRELIADPARAARLGARGRALVDGRGADRVVRAMLDDTVPPGASA